jgi:hypothetical protein
MKIIESNLRKVNNAIRAIEQFELKSNSRKRDKVYQRAFLMAKLRQMGCTLDYIGGLFGKNHATVLHNIENHKYFTKTADLEYRLSIAPVKETYKNMNAEIQANIFDDVISANDYEDLLTIKEKIHNGMYN